MRCSLCVVRCLLRVVCCAVVTAVGCCLSLRVDSCSLFVVVCFFVVFGVRSSLCAAVVWCRWLSMCRLLFVVVGCSLLLVVCSLLFFYVWLVGCRCVSLLVAWCSFGVHCLLLAACVASCVVGCLVFVIVCCLLFVGG